MTLYSSITRCTSLVLIPLTLIAGHNLPLQGIKRDTNNILGNPIDSLLNFTEFASKIGLDTEEHVVETEDGYLLRVFRVRRRICKVQGLPVVLNHGLLLDATCWIAAGELSPAFLIASSCIDLWLPNARGTRYSRAHTTLSPKKRAFWNFSVDEIGRYDVPAVIDYVLHNTGRARLNYIGFSQGCGTFYIMCSERPHHCKKIGTMIALAPATRHIHSKSELFRLVPDAIMMLESISMSIGVYEVFANGGPTQKFLHLFCPISKETLMICDGLKDLLGGDYAFHPGSVNEETLMIISGTFPAGTSVHNLARYGQSLQTKKFQKFDYGPVKNMKLYGSRTPPAYNFKAVICRVVVIYGINDGITDIADVEWSAAQLPYVVETVQVKDPLWNHFDMTYSQYFKQLVFPKINEHLNKFTS